MLSQLLATAAGTDPTPLQASWYESGAFFTRFTFGILATFFLSNKIREWLISDLPAKMRNLVNALRDEIDKLERQDAVSDDFDEIVKGEFKREKSALESELKSLRIWKNLILGALYTICFIALVGIIAAISTGFEKQMGCISLIILVIMFILRKWLGSIYNSTEQKHNEIAAHVNQLRERANMHKQNAMQNKLKTPVQSIRLILNQGPPSDHQPKKQ